MRLPILTEVAVQLAQILQANGFLTNLGEHLYYWRDLPFEYGEDGAISWADAETTITQIGGADEHRINLEITAISFTDDPLTMGCSIAADLVQAIGNAATAFGQGLSASPMTLTTVVETKGKTAVRIVAEFILTYRSGRYEI
ncbi:MAG: hypothetical protein HC934_02935 [Acaryochloridaceae cyanobacterium SU_2_1]|nr:hypothetical protein [Acaryochloridaceae cyanobacterium SU_2_1]